MRVLERENGVGGEGNCRAHVSEPVTTNLLQAALLLMVGAIPGRGLERMEEKGVCGWVGCARGG